MRSMRYLAVIGVAAAVAVTACNAGTPASQPANGAPWQAPSADDEGAIRALFDSTAAGWNRGDLATYMSPYADSAVGAGAGSFDMGKAAIERTMRAGFWRNGRPAQALHYEHIRVRMLGADYALVNGEFVLTGGDRPERRGLFSTVWARTSDGWRMINDHSG
jgi:uncharacterized protein (TIGR02246 family)